MLGFTSVAYEKYIRILMLHGYTVPIFNQVKESDEIKRELFKIVCPSTYIEESLYADNTNHMMCLYIEDELQNDGTYIICIGLSMIDLSTGQSIVYEVLSNKCDKNYSPDEAVRFINSFNPTEIIVFRKKIKKDNQLSTYLEKDSLISYLEIEDKNYRYTENIKKDMLKLSYQEAFLNKVYPNSGKNSVIENLDLELIPYALQSFILLLNNAYLYDNNIINNINTPEIFDNNKHLILGNNAVYQLDVLNNSLHKNTRFKSLFDVVNNTSTAIGKRYLKCVLISPITNSDILMERYDNVDNFIKNDNYKTVEGLMTGILDIERLYRKVLLSSVHPFELNNLYESYVQIDKLFDYVKTIDNVIKDQTVLDDLKIFIQDFNETFLLDELRKYRLNDITGTVFKKGIFSDIDELQDNINNCYKFMHDSCDILTLLINKTNTKHKINLKETKDDFYLDITKTREKILREKLSEIKSLEINDYILKTDDIVFKPFKNNTKITFLEFEMVVKNVMTLRDELTVLIKEKYIEVLNKYCKKYNSMFKNISRNVEFIDFIKSNAKTAKLYNYTKPQLIKQDYSFINCKQLRHPIIERINQNTEYIPHDINIGQNNDINGMLIYGLNSSGKSSLMKAIGLSVIMAQCGMYVPCNEFSYSPYYTLMARITGCDNIFKGLSSFELEMTELNAILRRSNKNTLVIGDEVCRGTEHISGTSIVATTIKFLSTSEASFVFATHLHEIAELEEIQELDNVKAFHLTITHDKETDTLIYDRLLKEGSGEKIYGVTVAKHIINDPEFMKQCNKIQNKLLEKNNELLTTKTSKYNSSVYMDSCGICESEFANQEYISFLDSHHINFQKDCEDGFVKEKSYLPMNSKANLIPLCKKCHHDVHHNKLKIDGYISTSSGVKIQYSYVSVNHLA